MTKQAIEAVDLEDNLWGIQAITVGSTKLIKYN